MAFLAQVAVPRQFVLFGPLHLLILALTVALPAALAWLVRGRPRATRHVAWGLAAMLALEKVIVLPLAIQAGRIPRWPEGLPMHLCDWASFAVIVALLGRGALAYELAYFWGLGGTLQALLTPDTPESPGSPLFIGFFISHCGIVASILFLTWACGARPRPRSPWHVWLWSQLYLAAAGLVNGLWQTNFGYLAGKPRQSSLLDVFSPWPWYVLEMDLIALALFYLLYLPFARSKVTAAADPARGSP
jgi:hypothetical integral membrane protein (TIGR02206 family)